MLTDMLGNEISVGDIVLFTEPGAGRNLPGLRLGEVQGLTKASVRMFFLTTDYKREEYNELVDDLSVPPYYTDRNGRVHYKQKKTGNRIEKDPVAVKWFEDRFYIVRKI